MPADQCPLEEGDRIDHKIFGFGTVHGEPVATVRPNHQARGGVEPAGWRVSIKWDDLSRSDSQVMSQALRKVSSPDSRPFSYWDRRWQPLLAAWLAARRDLEQASMTFRPLPDAAVVKKLVALEASARDAMESFRRDETDGRHS